MNKETKVVLYFSIGEQEYRATQKFPKAVWRITEIGYKSASNPQPGEDVEKFHPTYTWIADIDCTSHDKDKIKAAFLALDECTDN